jgi:hypothetical protein
LIINFFNYLKIYKSFIDYYLKNKSKNNKLIETMINLVINIFLYKYPEYVFIIKQLSRELNDIGNKFFNELNYKKYSNWAIGDSDQNGIYSKDQLLKQKLLFWSVIINDNPLYDNIKLHKTLQEWFNITCKQYKTNIFYELPIYYRNIDCFLKIAKSYSFIEIRQLICYYTGILKSSTIIHSIKLYPHSFEQKKEIFAKLLKHELLIAFDFDMKNNIEIDEFNYLKNNFYIEYKK